MVIIKINGGLGNQMFQYALFLKLRSLGKEVYLDDEIIVDKLNNTKALKINDVFDLDYPLCSKRDCNRMADVSIDYLSRIRRRIFGKRLHEDTYYCEKDLDNNYEEEIYSLDNKYLDGCWQTEKYFESIRKTVLDAYTFNIDGSEINDYLSLISSTNSVSLHVRRGDYVNNSIYEGICTEEYYDNAIEYIKKHVNNPKFFIFSDDIEYVKNKYHGVNYVIVEGFDNSKSHYDMFLMSMCKHNIVANSSFSWWGAWLNQNAEKIVVCPHKWGNRAEYRYTPCESWVKIKNSI